MELVKADAGQVAEIAALWHEGWHVGHAAVVPEALVATRTLAEFLPRTQGHLATTWVAMMDGALAGFVMLEDGELYQFYVAGSQRGKGVAAPLMDAAEAQMKQNGVTQGWLACSVGNDRAARFYEKCGWSRARTEPYDLETAQGPMTIDVWIYEKMLG